MNSTSESSLPMLDILLADDDHDDCLFFREALEELPLPARFTAVHDGEKLLALLALETTGLPHVLFLDLNMPRKNGFDCLQEIKQSKKLKSLPVVIFSTSYEPNLADLLYNNGAHYYICKPADFTQLKKVIQHTLILLQQEHSSQPPKEKFLLSNLKTLLL